MQKEAKDIWQKKIHMSEKPHCSRDHLNYCYKQNQMLVVNNKFQRGCLCHLDNLL